MNSWLDPTTVGRFDRESTVEIRTSLTLEDTPPGIPGETYPMKEDLNLRPVEYPISPGDVLNVEINELRDRQIPYLAQVQVTSTGYINLPIVGRVEAGGHTLPEFEKSLAQALREKEILLEPQVTVNAQFLQRGTYSVFGIGVSASDNSPLRAGTFPIRRPDLRVLEAINQVGGLNEFVSDVYIFRYADVRGLPARKPDSTKANGGESEVPKNGAENGQVKAAWPNNAAEPKDRSAVAELLEAARPVEPPPARADRVEAPPTSVGDLAPERTPPFLWVNNEWVANPTYQRPETDTSAPAGGPASETTTPAVNWARIAGESNYRVIRIPAESLRNGDPESNIYVRAGDVLRIVSGEIGAYYVMGQVNRVGAFNFNAEPITLKAAIAVAGGLSGLAWPDRCTIYRRQGLREQMIQVNLDRVFAGKDPDLLIKRGDIVNVGTHPFAPFLQRIRSWTLPNPVNNVGYSFTYSRNFADIDSFSVKQNPANEPDRFPALFP